MPPTWRPLPASSPGRRQHGHRGRGLICMPVRPLNSESMPVFCRMTVMAHVSKRLKSEKEKVVAAGTVELPAAVKLLKAPGDRFAGRHQEMQVSTRRSTSRSGWASIRSRPIRSCAARSCCRTASARRCGWSSLPRATTGRSGQGGRRRRRRRRRTGREDQGRLDRFRRVHRRART